MSARQTLSPVPLVLAVALAAAALVFSRGSSPNTHFMTALASDTPRSPTSPSPSPTPTVPACVAGDMPAPNSDYPQWRKTLLDTAHRLPPGYVPPDLTPTAQAGLVGPSQVRSFVIPDLKALADAATAAGHPLAIVAAYRSFQQQGELLRQRITELGQVRASRRVAQPGHSEHQLGTAIDFTSQGLPDVSVVWASSPTGKWMAQNSWQYGFLLSYPDKKMDVTCYRGEPWHFRYVGRRMAAKVAASGLTLREYLWGFAFQASPGP